MNDISAQLKATDQQDETQAGTTVRNLKPQIEILLIIIITLACLIPFINKAIHIDDPLFIWIARHIQEHPLDPMGFMVNWFGASEPMYGITTNPILTSYFIAIAASILGWSESSLHFAFLIPALAVILGSYYLARSFCRHSMVAALATLTTPAFMISATTVMCDILMLAFLVWAVVFWLNGVKLKKHKLLIVSVLLLSACVLTKYNGAIIIPILAIYTFAKERRFGAWAYLLAVPIVALAAYQCATYIAYDQISLFNAAAKSTMPRTGSANWLIGLSYMGGCIIIALFFAFNIWSRSAIAAWGALGLAGAALLLFTGFGRSLAAPSSATPGIALHFGVFLAVGTSIMLLSLMDYLRNRNPESLLLLLWIWGSFAFSALFAWAGSGRYLLPTVPAAAVLLVRGVEFAKVSASHSLDRRFILPVILAALVSLIVSYADYSQANANRIAADSITAKYGKNAETLWFQGHWGFQYYMELNGAQALDLSFDTIGPKDILAVPENNVNTHALNVPVKLIENIAVESSPISATMDWRAGTGFHGAIFGPVPYRIGRMSPQKYFIIAIDESK